MLATFVAEAWEPLQRRDYAALRSLTGVAPATKRSGKMRRFIRRLACHPRLANAVYHWACVAVSTTARGEPNIPAADSAVTTMVEPYDPSQIASLPSPPQC